MQSGKKGFVMFLFSYARNVGEKINSHHFTHISEPYDER